MNKLFKLNKFLALIIFSTFILSFYLSSNSHLSYSSEGFENFYDFVNDERQNEISDVLNDVSVEDIISRKGGQRIFLGRSISLVLILTWLVIMYYVSRKHLRPYDVSPESVELDWLMTLRPNEVSALINLCDFSKRDLVITLFDLTNRGILDMSGHNVPMRIYINEGKFSESIQNLENYEVFLIQWFFNKIGNKEYFDFNALNNYLSLKSNAIEFDLDYDIWQDELFDFVNKNKIIDDVSKRWKTILEFIGIGYAFLGTILLYLTSSTTPLLLFIVTFLTYRIPLYTRRRSRYAEEKYKSLIMIKEKFTSDLMTKFEHKETNEQDKYFVYGIALKIPEDIIKGYKRYWEFFTELDNGLDKAIMTSNSVTNSIFT